MSTESKHSDPERKHLGSTLRIILGIVFLLLGVIGALLPVLQGWLFFLVAIVLFFPNHPRVERILIRAEPKFPRLVAWLRRMGIGWTESPEIARLDLGELIHPHHGHDSAVHESPRREEGPMQVSEEHVTTRQ